MRFLKAVQYPKGEGVEYVYEYGDGDPLSRYPLISFVGLG